MHRGITDRILADALKKRAMQDLRAGRTDAAANIVNNLYGGGGLGHGGLREQMSGATPDEDPDRDYFVDIARTNNEDGSGWTKNVHRYAKPKGEDGDPKKKKRAR